MTERTAGEIKQAVLERYSTKAREQLAKAEPITLTPVAEESCCGTAEAPQAETS